MSDPLILGEGNTSARVDAETFWVKASGFVQVSFERVLALLNQTNPSDQQVKDGLTAAKIDPNVTAHPSVETLLHALCLGLKGVNFVGHTHPVAINSLTCSAAFETAFRGRLFSDEIVVCGPAPLLVPYTDADVPLARVVKRLLSDYVASYGEPPRVVILQNDGMIPLGRSISQVENITAMMVKTARILLGTFAAGGPRFMPATEVERIHGHRMNTIGESNLE